MATKNFTPTVKAHLTAVLEEKRAKAIAKGKLDRAYDLTVCIGMVRKADRPTLNAMMYEYVTAESQSPAQPNVAQLTLF